MLVAVTTAPRPDYTSYLAATLATLDGRPSIFVDSERRGARWNTWRALGAASGEDRLLLLQDDLVCEPGLIARAASTEIPADVGVVNFHDCGDDFYWQPVPSGIHKFRSHRDGGLGMVGAQCLLMTGEHAAWLARQDLSTCPQPGPHNADFAIGWFTSRSPRPYKLIISPSPIRHVGERSACWENDRRAVGARIPHAGRTIKDLMVGR